MDELDQRNEEDWHSVHGTFGVGGVLAGLWMGVFYFYPRFWAVCTVAVICLLLGLLTAKGIFKAPNNRTAFALAPIIGGCWIAFFYILFLVLGV
jgi:hypothetical protein